MASNASLLLFGTLLTILIISTRSAPIGKTKENSPSTVINSNSDKTKEISKTNGEEKFDKKKRQTNDDDLEDVLDHIFDDEQESDEQRKDSLHAETRETSAQIHDNGKKTTEIDDSKVFSDLKMNPTELTTIGRQRRDLRLKLNENRRRKRAVFSPYQYFDTDEIYDPMIELVEEDSYVRPSRSFAPIYWYPSLEKRNQISSKNYLIDEPVEYSIVPEDDDEDPVFFLDNDVEDDVDEDDDDDDDDNRYPIILDLSKNPFDNLQLQQNYNDDIIPLDEDENLFFDEENNDDEQQLEQYPIAYEPETLSEFSEAPIENYF